MHEEFIKSEPTIGTYVVDPFEHSSVIVVSVIYSSMPLTSKLNVTYTLYIPSMYYIEYEGKKQLLFLPLILSHIAFVSF